MRRLTDRLIPPVAALLIKTLHASMRLRHDYSGATADLLDQKRSYVLAFWHGHLLMMVKARYPGPIVAMISKHRDGELITRTVSYFGAIAARGSTSRGGSSALREMIAAARQGRTLGITPDGPRGPRHKAQMGVVQVAQATGLPVVPAVFVAEKKKMLRSWDRFEIPCFFSRGVFAYGEPVLVPRRASKNEMEEKRLQIEQALNALVEETEQSFAQKWERGRI
ncbi:MAG: lysophospholipid acyltransferase family protein [Acidobacteria bacterium]|nr:lysophospholipid acyltransferase family protein [Acidobacteriota bacterium]